MQAAHLADQFVAGTQIKMVGIRKQDLHAEVFEILLGLSFYRRGRAHRHESRRINHAVRSGEPPEPRTGRIGGQHFELGNRWSVDFRTRSIRTSVSGERGGEPDLEQ